MARDYPRQMYHAPGQDGRYIPPVMVHTKDEENKLGSEWYRTYIPQPFPETLYTEDGQQKIVQTYTERDAALAAGWSKQFYPTKLATFQAGVQIATPSSAIDADTFQKIQDIEFETATSKSKIEDLRDAMDAKQVLIDQLAGRLGELQRDFATTNKLVEGLVAMLAKATGASVKSVAKQAVSVQEGG